MSEFQQRQRVVQPPLPSDTSASHQWLRLAAEEINRLPPMSTFSSTTPESVISGNPGEFASNQITPTASTSSRLWVKISGIGNTGWASLVTDGTFAQSPTFSGGGIFSSTVTASGAAFISAKTQAGHAGMVADQLRLVYQSSGLSLIYSSGDTEYDVVSGTSAVQS